MTRYPVDTPGPEGLNLSVKSVPFFPFRDPSVGSIDQSPGVSGVNRARKSE